LLLLTKYWRHSLAAQLPAQVVETDSSCRNVQALAKVRNLASAECESRTTTTERLSIS
jgi:hypothetical protein